MMTDKRSYDGWRRLSRAVMAEVAHDDPAGLRQVREQLDELERMYSQAMAQLAGVGATSADPDWRPYSHGEIARELGVTRQAVSKRISSVA